MAGLNCFNGRGNFQAGKVVAFMLFFFNSNGNELVCFPGFYSQSFVLNRVSFVVSTHSTGHNAWDNRTSNACENHVSPLTEC